MNARTLFFLGLILSATGIISPPIALALGLLFGLTAPHPYPADSKALSRFLLQASIVLLGFGMDLQAVLRAGRSGFVYTALGIAFALAAGWLLGRLLQVRGTASFLISVGTAICGGSAIAAVAPIVRAEEEEMAVSLGTIFILNSIALFLFPPLGWRLHLTQPQFGMWAALAIHDTSSVVGAASRYGAEALVIATTVKLTRALWIVPVALATAMVKKSSARTQWPWFILLFAAAAVINTYVPGLSAAWKTLSQLGRLGLTATLYLIGTGISIATMKRVGPRPMLQGLLLWALVASTTLWLILRGIIAS